MTSLISRFRWPMRGLVAMTLALVFALSSTISAFAFTLVQLSSDPYSNPTSQHATEVEPDTLSSGSTFVSAFQVGRFFDGGGSNIGFATSTDGGSSFSHGFLPGTTPFSTPPGIYGRTSDADRKSTRLNSSHTVISYAVFCLKKKKREPGARRSKPQTHRRRRPSI